MNWSKFLDSVGAFFSDIGSVFLANIKASIPQAEQAALNILEVIADAVVAGIESGAIPLPVLAAEEGQTVDALTLGKIKRDVAFSNIQTKLATTTIPEGMVISNSLIYFSIEVAVQKNKQMGNGGQSPSGDFSKTEAPQ